MPSEIDNPHAHIRRLWRSDRTAMQDHLLRLDADSRRLRFGGAVSDSFLGQYVDHCFGQGDLVFGGFIHGILRGGGGIAFGEGDLGGRPAAGPQHPRRGGVQRRAGVSQAGYRRQAVPAHPGGGAQIHGVEHIEVLCLPEIRRDAEARGEIHDRIPIRGRFRAWHAAGAAAHALFDDAGGRARDLADFGEAAFELQRRALLPRRRRLRAVGQGRGRP